MHHNCNIYSARGSNFTDFWRYQFSRTCFQKIEVLTFVDKYVVCPALWISWLVAVEAHVHLFPKFDERRSVSPTRMCSIREYRWRTIEPMTACVQANASFNTPPMYFEVAKKRFGTHSLRVGGADGWSCGLLMVADGCWWLRLICSSSVRIASHVAEFYSDFTPIYSNAS